MKLTVKSLALFGLAAVLGVTAAATPAQARWYDGHEWHRGHAPRGWVWDARHGYYIAAPAVVVAQPPPGMVIVQQPGQPVVVQQQPQAVIVQQPAPVIVEQPAPPPVGLNLGVHIR